MTLRDLMAQLENLPEEWRDLPLHDFGGDIRNVKIEPSRDGCVPGIGRVPTEPDALSFETIS